MSNSLTSSGRSSRKASQASPSTHVHVVVTEGARLYVSDRPEYIPNPGPSLDPVSVMAINDLDGVIEQEVQVDPFTWYYVVTHPNQPALNIRVKPQNIGNWVSARTLENWEIRQSAIREKDQEEYHQELERKRKRKNGKRKLDEIEDPEEPEERQQLPWNWKRSSATFADTISPFTSPDSKRKAHTERNPVTTFKSPTKSTGKGPSLASPVVTLGLNTVMASDSVDDSNDNEEEDDVAIAFQLSSEINVPNSRRSTPSCSARNTPLFEKSSQSRSGSSVGSATPHGPGFPARHVVNPSKSAERSPLFSGRNPSASMSSLAAFQEVERLEKAQSLPLIENVAKVSHSKSSPSKNHSKVISQSISQRYSNFKKGPTMFNKLGSQGSPLKSVQQPYDLGPEPNEDIGEELLSEEDASGDEVVEDEWEVEEILKDGMQPNEKGSLELRYLIRWVGDWDDTWEPPEYVSADLIAAYKAKKRSQKSSNGYGNNSGQKKSKLLAESGMKNITSYFGIPKPTVPEDDVASSDGLFVSDDEASMVRKNKGK